MLSWRSNVVSVLVSAAVAAGGAWLVQGWRYEAKISNIEREQASLEAEAAKRAVKTLHTDIDRISAAAKEAMQVAPALTAQVNTLSKALKNATPLPADCFPDADRVRSLTESVRAANRAATGQ